MHFRSVPGSSQTEVRVGLNYEPLGGALVAWAAKLSPNDPETQVQNGLHRFNLDSEVRSNNAQSRPLKNAHGKH